jgi:hypothetical protein
VRPQTAAPKQLPRLRPRELSQIIDKSLAAARMTITVPAASRIGKDYHAATWSGRSDAIFGDVLLACACAQADERG